MCHKNERSTQYCQSKRHTNTSANLIQSKWTRHASTATDFHTKIPIHKKHSSKDELVSLFLSKQCERRFSKHLLVRNNNDSCQMTVHKYAWIYDTSQLILDFWFHVLDTWFLFCAFLFTRIAPIGKANEYFFCMEFNLTDDTIHYKHN